MTAHAHELSDGFVERSVAMVVRPGEATVKYSIGANKTTRRQLVQSWNDGWNASKGDDRSQPQDIDKTFLRVVGEALVQRLTFEADGKPLKLEIVEVIATPRHHVEVTVVMRAKLPEAKAGANTIALNFRDRNFSGHNLTGQRPTNVARDIGVPTSSTTHTASEEEALDDVMTAEGNSDASSLGGDGAFRYAVKGAGGVMLNRSTVAPILIRATRHLDADLSPAQKNNRQQFSAEVILPK